MDLKYVLITKWYHEEGDPDLFNEIAEVQMEHDLGYTVLYNGDFSFYISKRCCMVGDSLEYLETIKYLS